MNHTYLRGDMYYADLGRGIGSEQEGYRPVVIIQNNVAEQCWEQTQPHSHYRFHYEQNRRESQTSHPLLHRRRGRLGAALYRPAGTVAHRR